MEEIKLAAKSAFSFELPMFDRQSLSLTEKSRVDREELRKLSESENKVGKELGESAPKFKGTGNEMRTIGEETKQAADQASEAGTKFSGLAAMINRSFMAVLKRISIYNLMNKAIKELMSYMRNSLQTNKTFSDSLSQVKTNLKVAFQPVYDYILPAINAFMKGLATATTYMAVLANRLFGKRYEQSFEAAKGLEEAKRSMDSYGVSAKKVQGILAGFDELNTLSFDDSERAAGSEMVMPNDDLTETENKINRVIAAFGEMRDYLKMIFGPAVKEAFSGLTSILQVWRQELVTAFSGFTVLGEPLKSWLTGDLIPFYQEQILRIGEILKGLLETGAQIFSDMSSAVMPIIEWFVSDGLSLIVKLSDGASEVFMSLFQNTKSIFDKLWQEGVKPALDLLSGIIRDVLDLIYGWWEEWGEKIVSSVIAAIDSIVGVFEALWDNFLGPIWESLITTMSWLWEAHLKGLVKEVVDFVTELALLAMEIFNKFIAPVVQALIEKLGPGFANAIAFIIETVGTVVGVLADIAKGIIRVLRGIIEFVAGVFTDDWKRAWEGIKLIFEGIGMAIAGVFKGVVNEIIDVINYLIRGMNRISIDIPDWVPGVGGRNFGVNISQIPKLADGGLISAPTLAMVGDNKNVRVDPEVVSPLSKLETMIGTAVTAAMQQANQSQQGSASVGDLVIKIGESEFARIAINAINRAQRQAGAPLLEV